MSWRFRSFTPAERDTLMGRSATVMSVKAPWLNDLMLVFNTKRPPFDDARVRRALSLAIDRWGMARRLTAPRS